MQKVLVLLFILSVVISAQTVDTLNVPNIVDNDPLGAINKTIQGDTTSTGERVNPNRVYQLLSNKVYLLDGPLTTTNYNLVLVGQESTSERPPVLIPGILADGSVPDPLASIHGNLTLKNVYFVGTALNNAVTQWKDYFQIFPDEARIIVDNCIFEGFEGNAIIAVKGKDADVFMTNNIFRNNISRGDWYGGGACMIYNFNADTAIVRNNTFVNNGSYIYTDRDFGTRYLRIEHNTVANYAGFPFYLHMLTNTTINDNIFFNCTFASEDTSAGAEFVGGWNDRDLMPASIISIDTLATGEGERLLLDVAEDERFIQVNNNAYFWDQRIIDKWPTVTKLNSNGVGWMNTRTTSMFADKNTWPLLEENNNQNVNPNFLVEPTVLDSIMTFIENIKGWSGGTSFAYPEGQKKFQFSWPLPENLSYSNEALKTAGRDGFPIGDLNWFPDKKAEWLTDVEEINSTIPDKFTLQQNYPNPFNPTTNIEFAIPENGLVSLKVFNVLGEEVVELLNKELASGTYNVNFDASKLTTGIYFYTLNSNNFVQTKKMLLLR